MDKNKRTTIIKRINLRMIIILVICIIAIVTICFGIIQPRLIENVISYDDALSSQISKIISSDMDDLSVQSDYIMSAISVEEALTEYEKEHSEHNYNTVRLTLQQLINNSTKIRSVSVMSEDGTVFDTITGSTDTDKEMLKKYSSSNDASEISGFWTEFYHYNNDSHWGSCRRIEHTIHNHNYIFFFYYKNTSLITTINTLVENHFDAFILTDYYGSPLLSSEGKYNANPLIENKSGYYSKDNGYYFTNMVLSRSLIFTGYAAMNTMRGYTDELFFIILFFCILVCMAIWLNNVHAISRFLKPLTALNESMKAISSSNTLTLRSDISTNDEIGELSDVFNKMLDHIEAHTGEIIEYQNRENKLRYNLLIAQIDSHFISNTMTNINSLAMDKDYEGVIKLNTALLHILQNTLRVKNYMIADTFEQEIKVLKDYITIQNIRYLSDVSVHFDLPEEARNILIPKSILQPVVENSYHHGLMDLETGKVSGNIYIRSYLDNENIIINIRDDGCGVEKEQLDELNQLKNYDSPSSERGKHISLKNIFERLDYIYKGRATLSFENKVGLSATYTIPITYSEQEKKWI